MRRSLRRSYLCSSACPRTGFPDTTSSTPWRPRRSRAAAAHRFGLCRRRPPLNTRPMSSRPERCRRAPTTGTTRDVLTLFDEGGIVVAAADAELASLLREFRWKELFWRRRAEVQRSMRFYVFGHAIYEKALEPYKGVTAKALIVDTAPGLLDAPIELQLTELDTRAADYFSGSQALSSTRNLPPLPILGIPGWDPSNGSEAYYDDASQFRPGRLDAR